MKGYKLTSRAVADLDQICAYREKHRGAEAAMQLEESILAACERLVITPGMGHRRSDLTSRPHFFYAVDPYLIVYARYLEPRCPSFASCTRIATSRSS